MNALVFTLQRAWEGSILENTEKATGGSQRSQQNVLWKQMKAFLEREDGGKSAQRESGAGNTQEPAAGRSRPSAMKSRSAALEVTHSDHPAQLRGNKPQNPKSSRDRAKEPKPLRTPEAPALREEPPALTESGSAGSGRGSLSPGPAAPHGPAGAAALPGRGEAGRKRKCRYSASRQRGHLW